MVVEKVYVPTLDGGSIEFDGARVVTVVEYEYGRRAGLRTTWTTTIPLSNITYIQYRRAGFFVSGWIFIGTPGKDFKLRMGLRNRDQMIELLDAIVTAKAAL